MIGKIISHYKILEKLGGGGMGVVYKAEDTKLKRTVALKFLPPSFSLDDDAKQRFIHEAQAVSSLDHNNICVVHEIDETDDGQIFISMNCYDGETLKKKIECGPLKIDEAIDIIIQNANGLQKAHEKGIVHRDIKPANIYITNDGIVKILDFGLAKVTGQTKLTQMGSTAGTVAYMSPEQTRGEQVDHRTDIWSLGVVLYEMVAGERPFKGDYEQAVIYSILNEEPQEISSLRSDVPKGVVSVIGKALQKDCKYRYQTMKEFIADLKSGRASTIELPKQEKSIAVLPFINDSPDQENTYFINGVMEEILNNLQKIKELRVISRSSVEQYRNQRKPIKEIAKELGVNYVVEGSGQKYGNAIRLRSQLINAEDEESHIWGESFQQEINDVKDIFRIQSQIAETIAKELKAFITPQEKQLIEKIPTENLEAYEAYLKGMSYACKLNPQDIDVAMHYFESALEKDPDFALAHTGVANVWCLRQVMGSLPPSETTPLFRAAAQRALDLDSTLAEVHYVCAFVKWFDWDWKGAEEAFNRAIEINPNYALARVQYSQLLAILKRPEEAIVQAQQAVELDPFNPVVLGLYGSTLSMLGRYDEAMTMAYKELRASPNSSIGLQILWLAHHFKGEYDKAFENAKAHFTAFGMDPVVQVMERGYETGGYFEAMRCAAEVMAFAAKEHYIQPFWIASLYATAGEQEQCLDWLEKGYKTKDPVHAYFTELELRSLIHDGPRYQALLHKMKFPMEE